jgi:hypothetical protein
MVGRLDEPCVQEEGLVSQEARSAAYVDLAPTLDSPIAQRYVLMHYGLGEPRLDAAAIAGAFQDQPLDAAEARIIAEGWHRG